MASEVGSLHAHSHSMSCNVCCVFCLFMFSPPSSQTSFLSQLFSPVCQATGEAAGEDVDSDSDSDDDDDDVRVTIGDIKTGAPQYA